VKKSGQARRAEAGQQRVTCPPRPGPHATKGTGTYDQTGDDHQLRGDCRSGDDRRRLIGWAILLLLFGSIGIGMVTLSREAARAIIGSKHNAQASRPAGGAEGQG
jgi:hypothetical protein